MRIFQSMLGALAIFAGTLSISADNPEMALVPAGQYAPLFRTATGAKASPVSSFHLDILPVTNADFLEFVTAHPKWRRSQAKRILAEGDYLKSWAGDLELGASVVPTAPVTSVSWHAAKSYAVWKGKRLPTTAEWEYAAGASLTRADGENDPIFMQEIRTWHSTPAPEKLPPVGQRPANFFGIKDLHGLVWEWTADFVLTSMNSDPRSDSGASERFCGGGSADSKDRENFPAFMRYGFRSSLKPVYTVHNLGFRCAMDSK